MRLIPWEEERLQLFAAAELRLGTAPQRVVRIVRTDAVWRETTQ